MDDQGLFPARAGLAPIETDARLVTETDPLSMDTDGDGIHIETFHYPFGPGSSSTELVALGSCDGNETMVGHNNSCPTLIGFSLTENDIFSNTDRMVFNSNAPLGEYTIKYELVDTLGTTDTLDDVVLSNAYEVTSTLTTPIPPLQQTSGGGGGGRSRRSNSVSDSTSALTSSQTTLDQNTVASPQEAQNNLGNTEATGQDDDSEVTPTSGNNQITGQVVGGGGGDLNLSWWITALVLFAVVGLVIGGGILLFQQKKDLSTS